jgi:hypothetical protein
VHRHHRIGAALAALGLAATALPAAALAEAHANSKQSQKIGTAVHNSSQTKSVPDREYKVTDIFVSTHPKGWAKATIKGKPGFTKKVQTAGVVLHFKGGKWKVVAVGGSGLGCDVPAAVSNDLKLGGCGY